MGKRLQECIYKISASTKALSATIPAWKIRPTEVCCSIVAFSPKHLNLPLEKAGFMWCILGKNLVQIVITQSLNFQRKRRDWNRHRTLTTMSCSELWKLKLHFSRWQPYESFAFIFHPKGCCTCWAQNCCSTLGKRLCSIFTDKLDRLLLLLTEVGVAYFAAPKWVGLKPKLVGGAQ